MKVFALKPDIEFTPDRKVQEGRIISIFLAKGEGNHSWRCNMCGKIAFQYTGEPDFIFDGAIIPEDRAEINIRCHRCKVTYRVRSI